MYFSSCSEESDNGSLSLAVLGWGKGWIYLSELDLFEPIHAYALVPADLLSYVIILACKKQENAI